MALKKPAVTAKILQALLTRIGSTSSGTKSTLLARFQREIQQPGVFRRPSEGDKPPRKPWNCKLRVMSIDMGIKNLAFCDAEVTYPVTGFASEPNLGATMNVLRWKKIDLVSSAYNQKDRLPPESNQKVVQSIDEDADPYSPSVLSKTAHRLITEQVLSASPDIILIEKQRWRSGGGSAVQQWTVRVNTLEAMLWAILETLKTAPPYPSSSSVSEQKPAQKRDYTVHAIDPKRVGQYWLSRHARALQERNEPSPAPSPLSPPPPKDDSPLLAKKQPTRTKAEKAAKINILRTWLSHPNMSTEPSSPSLTPHIGIAIAPAAQSTLHALLPSQATASAPPLRQRRKSKAGGKRHGVAGREDADADAEEGPEEARPNLVPAAEMKKLDDVTDCFLQAAAWVAWEVNRVQLRRVGGGLESSSGAEGVVDENWIARAVEGVGEV